MSCRDLHGRAGAFSAQRAGRRVPSLPTQHGRWQSWQWEPTVLLEGAGGLPGLGGQGADRIQQPPAAAAAGQPRAQQPVGVFKGGSFHSRYPRERGDAGPGLHSRERHRAGELSAAAPGSASLLGGVGSGAGGHTRRPIRHSCEEIVAFIYAAEPEAERWQRRDDLRAAGCQYILPRTFVIAGADCMAALLRRRESRRDGRGRGTPPPPSCRAGSGCGSWN